MFRNGFRQRFGWGYAFWHPEHLALLAGKTLEDDEFLHAATDRATPEGEAIEAVLKGIEIPLPAGNRFADQTGTLRDNFRARWWEAPAAGIRCRDLVFPATADIPALPAASEATVMLRTCPADAPPVFVGHCFKPADSPLLPERPNVAVLDHSAAKDVPLVAYRWNGEATINPNHYLTHA